MSARRPASPEGPRPAAAMLAALREELDVLEAEDASDGRSESEGDREKVAGGDAPQAEYAGVGMRTERVWRQREVVLSDEQLARKNRLAQEGLPTAADLLAQRLGMLVGKEASRRYETLKAERALWLLLIDTFHSDNARFPLRHGAVTQRQTLLDAEAAARSSLEFTAMAGRDRLGASLLVALEAGHPAPTTPPGDGSAAFTRGLKPRALMYDALDSPHRAAPEAAVSPQSVLSEDDQAFMEALCEVQKATSPSVARPPTSPPATTPPRAAALSADDAQFLHARNLRRCHAREEAERAALGRVEQAEYSHVAEEFRVVLALLLSGGGDTSRAITAETRNAKRLSLWVNKLVAAFRANYAAGRAGTAGQDEDGDDAELDSTSALLNQKLLLYERRALSRSEDYGRVLMGHAERGERAQLRERMRLVTPLPPPGHGAATVAFKRASVYAFADNIDACLNTHMELRQRADAAASPAEKSTLRRSQ